MTYSKIETDKEEAILEDPQLAGAMREGTKAIHRAAEQSVFTKKFIKGDITIDEYGRYIQCLYYVYSAMEELLDKYKDCPEVKAVHFPKELNRTHVLRNGNLDYKKKQRKSQIQSFLDIEHYYGKERLAQLTDIKNMTPAVKEYVDSMVVACKLNPALMIAYSYTRYLGDLSGGQILAGRLKKHVLGLDEKDSLWDSTKGVEFYYFDNIGNQNEFKATYRDCLDSVKVTQKVKDLIVEESLKCFALNIAVFDEIYELSQKKELAPVNSIEKVDSHKSISFWGTVITGITAVALGVLIFHKQR
ncbi:hypothetical protein BDF14DRAFT_1966195 [Spinellus fusiger]|nr:hypothetical protein BDF14DRAFT_1966195 [Spinellus fusiger]